MYTFGALLKMMFYGEFITDIRLQVSRIYDLFST